MLTSNRCDLSPRQVECARLAAKGYADKQIATMLDLHPQTVKNHLTIARAKVGARNRTELALAVIRAEGR